METHAEADSNCSSARDGILTSVKDLIVGIDHVAVAVEDLEAAIGWYANCLGFTLVERRITHGERTSMETAILSAGNARVVLIQGTGPESQVSRYIQQFGMGVQHLAFAVSNLDEAIRRVTNAGGALDTDQIEDVGIRQAFLRRDPGSGVRIELIERSGVATFTDRSVERLFRAFEERNLY